MSHVNIKVVKICQFDRDWVHAIWERLSKHTGVNRNRWGWNWKVAWKQISRGYSPKLQETLQSFTKQNNYLTTVISAHLTVHWFSNIYIIMPKFGYMYNIRFTYHPAEKSNKNYSQTQLFIHSKLLTFPYQILPNNNHHVYGTKQETTRKQPSLT